MKISDGRQGSPEEARLIPNGTLVGHGPPRSRRLVFHPRSCWQPISPKYAILCGKISLRISPRRWRQVLFSIRSVIHPWKHILARYVIMQAQMEVLLGQAFLIPAIPSGLVTS